MSTEDRKVHSTSSNLDVRQVPNFLDLLRGESRQLYMHTISQENVVACSICGPLAYDGSGHEEHLCDHPTCKPHGDHLFIVDTLFPICFCKNYTPNEEGELPPAYVQTLAEVFMQVATTYKIFGVLVPACDMKYRDNHGEESRMLGLYFYANTTVEVLNKMFNTDAFNVEGNTKYSNTDWEPMLHKVWHNRGGQPPKPVPPPAAPIRISNNLIPFHLPGRGQS